MDRREFVKRTGIASVGLGALGASPAALAARPGFPKGNGHQHFSLVALSRVAELVDGVDHRIVVEGAGSFKPAVAHADGGGNFVHLDWLDPLAGPIASGKWEVTDFIDYSDPVGDYGRVRASILTVSVTLRPDAGGSLDGTLEIACNVGFAGILTGKPEGFELSVAGLDFDTPFVGLTHISIPEGASSA